MQIWAHRGASVDAPENTLPAIELALQQGADGVEIDVQLSSDGRVVVLHDGTVDRTTDGTGAVRALSWSALRVLDASAGDPRYTGARIPTLEDVLEVTRHAVVNIELKNDEVAYPGLEEKVVETVAACGAADRVAYSTFSPDSIRTLRALGVSASVGLLYSRVMWRPVREAVRLGATAIHPPAVTVDPVLIRVAHWRGLRLNSWTVNDADQVRWMARWGADAIITDRPGMARAALEGR